VPRYGRAFWLSFHHSSSFVRRPSLCPSERPTRCDAWAAHSWLLLLIPARRCLIRSSLVVTAERRPPIRISLTLSRLVPHPRPLPACIRSAFSHSPSVIAAFLSVFPLALCLFLPALARYRSRSVTASLSLYLSLPRVSAVGDRASPANSYANRKREDHEEGGIAGPAREHGQARYPTFRFLFGQVRDATVRERLPFAIYRGSSPSRDLQSRSLP
jgi:hypothetical protein